MKIIAGFLFSSLIMMSCTSHVNETAPCVLNDEILYTIDIYPIIDRTCAIPECHVSGFEYGNFKDATELKQAAINGKLEFMIATLQMPPSNTQGPRALTDCEISIIKKWIRNGVL